eukprot:COSAG04_NODE_1293_length_7335_cov_5.083472_1_plen_178_part_10
MRCARDTCAAAAASSAKAGPRGLFPIGCGSAATGSAAAAGLSLSRRGESRAGARAAAATAGAEREGRAGAGAEAGDGVAAAAEARAGAGYCAAAKRRTSPTPRRQAFACRIQTSQAKLANKVCKRLYLEVRHKSAFYWKNIYHIGKGGGGGGVPSFSGAGLHMTTSVSADFSIRSGTG